MKCLLNIGNQYDLQFNVLSLITMRKFLTKLDNPNYKRN